MKAFCETIEVVGKWNRATSRAQMPRHESSTSNRSPACTAGLASMRPGLRSAACVMMVQSLSRYDTAAGRMGRSKQ